MRAALSLRSASSARNAGWSSPSRHAQVRLHATRKGSAGLGGGDVRAAAAQVVLELAEQVAVKGQLGLEQLASALQVERHRGAHQVGGPGDDARAAGSGDGEQSKGGAPVRNAPWRPS